MKLKKKLYHEHGKCITTQQCNKLTAYKFAARLAQTNLPTTADIANFVKATDFDNKKSYVK